MIACTAAPLAAYEAAQRLVHHGGVVWWKSAGARGDDGAFVACAPVETFVSADLDALDERWRAHQALWNTASPRCPIAAGFFSYELGKRLVGGNYVQQAASDWPELEFRFFDAVLEVSSNGSTRVLAVDAGAAERLNARLAVPRDPPATGQLLTALAAVEDEAIFLSGVNRVQEYLRAGDAYQVNLARRLAASVQDAGIAAGLSLAQQLERDTPAPYGFWYGPGTAGGRALVGNSPELFLRTSVDGVIETSPIKGTRPRTFAQDATSSDDAHELAGSDKDRAEHDMIVDLERNDLGRLCETGSVHVVEHARVLHLPTVHHLVSTVRGQLRQPRPNLRDLLTATFPGGSITGAPKRRAMEIIAELETFERGPYTGATGWLGAAGDLELAVAIRTAAIFAGRLSLGVGGGIVIDSEPMSELAETTTKSQAFARLWSP